MKNISILLLISLQVILLASCTESNTEVCDNGYSFLDGLCVEDRNTDSVEKKDSETETVEETTVKTHKMFELKDNQIEYFNVPYKRVDGVTQYLDVYYPEKITEDMPVFIYVHGGGFLWGNKDLIDETYQINHVDYKNRLNELGYIFISVEYQKVKNTVYPCLEGQISDVKDAIKWVRLNHEDLSGSDENIGLWGLSAGGALALAAALNPDNRYDSYYPEISSEVKYVIDFYGVTDIYDFYNFANYSNLSSVDLNAEYGRVDGHINMSSNLESNYQEIKEYVDIHSPLYNYEKTNVKISIYHGDSDHVVTFDSNAQTLFDRGTSLGNEVYLKSFNGKDHGFWWDTNEFYSGLLEQVIGDVLLFSR